MSKLFVCFPCTPSKQKKTANNVLTSTFDDEEGIVWQSDGRGYSKRQISKAVAVVLNGYDSQAAASSVDSTCDPATVDLWVQLYRPPFFEDGMVCPPALVLWWMKELERKDKLNQVQKLQNQSLLLYGPSSQPNPGIFLGQPPQQYPQQQQQFTQNNTSIGTPYSQIPFRAALGTTLPGQTAKAPGQDNGGPNTLVITSPGGSQPNIRVIYQDDTAAPKRVSAMGQYNNQMSQQQQSRPTAPQYDTLAKTFQQQLDSIALQQQQQADQALRTLQAQSQNNQSGPNGTSGQAQGAGSSRRGRGPPYSIIN